MRQEPLSREDGVALVMAKKCDLANENGALGTYLPKKGKKRYVF